MPPLRIFISYGRDQYAPLAARLAEDLTAKGYEVWYDQQLQSGRPWARDIQRQLDWLVEDPKTGRFIYLLSRHSTREDSFCLSELQYAIDNHVPIFPVVLETCKIPIEIYPLQRLDMRPCLPVEEHPEPYRRLLQTLVVDMEGQVEKRLVQQKIIESQGNEEVSPQSLPPKENLPKTPAKSLVIPGILKTRWVWVVAVAALLVAIIGVTSQGQWFVAAPPPAATIEPTLTLAPTAILTLAQTATLTLVPTTTSALAATSTATSTRTITPSPTIAPSPTPAPPPPTCTSIGQTWVSPVDGMTLVCVPAGEFYMGSFDWDNSASDHEKPVHKVFLDAFWMDQTEITNEMYQKCVSSGKCSARESVGGVLYPQVNVNWEDAKTYCDWAGQQLPSEAQWEKAARGTDLRIFPWGAQMPACSLANFSDCNLKGASAVGSYPAGKSPYGAYDMAGNVWEWVADWYDQYYYSSQSTWRNPTGPLMKVNHILRGGSWGNDWWDVRSALRYLFHPTRMLSSLGFRCAR